MFTPLDGYFTESGHRVVGFESGSLRRDNVLDRTQTPVFVLDANIGVVIRLEEPTKIFTVDEYMVRKTEAPAYAYALATGGAVGRARYDSLAEAILQAAQDPERARQLVAVNLRDESLRGLSADEQDACTRLVNLIKQIRTQA